MSDREKFLKEKISSLVPKETELESRGEHFDFHAPITCSVTTSHSIAVGFGDGKVRFFLKEKNLVLLTLITVLFYQ